MLVDQHGTIRVAEHEIEFEPKTHSTTQNLYRQEHVHCEIILDLIDVMLREEEIEPSEGKWAPPLILAPKKNGKLRFCVDYRQLNLTNNNHISLLVLQRGHCAFFHSKEIPRVLFLVSTGSLKPLPSRQYSKTSKLLRFLYIER